MPDPEIDPVLDRIHMAKEIEATEALRSVHADLLADMAANGEEISDSLAMAVDHHLGYDTVACEGELTGVEGEQKVIEAGGDIGEYWLNVGLGDGGFYDRVRQEGCEFCGCHTPGNCDGCA